MGFMEANIVIYLRRIYYPAGFTFPLMEISPDILAAELIREVCTVIMLLAVAGIAGKDRIQRFAYFLFSFAVWDILYYVGLKWLIDWPSSFMTWDILFLIPITWLGPVIAPVICSILMIVLSILLLYVNDNMTGFKLNNIEWSILILGAIAIFISFISDFAGIIISENLYNGIFTLPENNKFRQILTTFVPQHFHWAPFIIGVIFILLSMALMVRRFLHRNSIRKVTRETS